MSAHPVLSIEDVSVDYLVDPPVHAVKHVSLDLYRGEILGWPASPAAGSRPWPTRSPGCSSHRR